MLTLHDCYSFDFKTNVTLTRKKMERRNKIGAEKGEDVFGEKFKDLFQLRQDSTKKTKDSYCDIDLYSDGMSESDVRTSKDVTIDC